MSESESEPVETYSHDCRIVRDRDGGEPAFWYEGPMGRVKRFRSLERAKLYADVQTVMGGFREEKSGERGVPPSVARAREDVLIAYLVANPSMGVTWVARSFDLDEDTVRDYTDMVRKRAEEVRQDE